MRAQITLGIMLVIEILASIYGCLHGSNKTVGGFCWALAPIVLLPAIVPVTAFFFLALCFGVDEQKRLKRDTIAFKIISLCAPMAERDGMIRLCPTFWLMVVGLLAIGSALIFCSVTLWVSVGKLIDPTTRSFMLSLVLCIVGMPLLMFGVLGKIYEVKDKDLHEGLTFCFGISFLGWFWFSADMASRGQTFFYAFTHGGLLVAASMLVVFLVLMFGGLFLIKTVANKSGIISDVLSAVYNKSCPVIQIAPKKEDEK